MKTEKLFSLFMKVVHSLDCLNALCQSAYLLKGGPYLMKSQVSNLLEMHVEKKSLCSNLFQESFFFDREL